MVVQFLLESKKANEHSPNEHRQSVFVYHT